MRLSQEETRTFILYIQELKYSEPVQEMKQYIQHGDTNTYLHCLSVAYFSYLIYLRLHLSIDPKSLIRGAFLHDLYLYDWHDNDSVKWHGFHHPRLALLNAKKHYQLNAIEEDIIATHMWPLTLTRIPGSKEAIVVCSIDKVCSLVETFRRRQKNN